MQGMNIIFCQNLLIYFRRWRRREIISRLADHLAPGGLLVLGQGEITGWHPPGMQRVPSEHVLAWIRRQSDDE
jgi:chemotaxis protein methyltransferase CheR/type IV pilus assembly protein PilK